MYRVTVKGQVLFNLCWERAMGDEQKDRLGQEWNGILMGAKSKCMESKRGNFFVCNVFSHHPESW